MRIAKGCGKQTPIPHLHEETKILPIQEHLNLLCQQFLARALQLGHSFYNIATSHPGPLGTKKTLRSSFSRYPLVLPQTHRHWHALCSCSSLLLQVHHPTAAHRYVQLLACLPSLERGPLHQTSPVSTEEQSFLRAHWTTLSNLRSRIQEVLPPLKATSQP